MKGRKMQVIIFVIGVILLAWLFLPVISFAEGVAAKVAVEEAMEPGVKGVEEAVTAIETKAKTPEQTKTAHDLLEAAVETPAPNTMLKVTNAWAKPTLKGQSVGAAYLTIENLADKSAALLEVSASIAGRAEIHTHIHRAGIMQMRQLMRLDILSQDSQVMEPGGLHLMLFDLNKPLEKGNSFTLTLTFSDGSRKKTKVEIRDAG
ncbi:MAG: copper chaperone PCu(A)C [Rickettsiales bacterium]|nr:copper chaperone PCu(A)C [Rickettsiales bacterium]